MNSKKIAVIVALSALSVATNFAMISVYNVKFMDLFVFVGGFCFGPFVGGLIGVFSWCVYGVFNPFGFSLPVWLATMCCESFYGVAGGFVGRRLGGEVLGLSRGLRRFGVFFGAFGVFLTFVYDVVTNVAFGVFFYGNVLYSVIVGFVPFGLVHVLSNCLFFGVGCVPAIVAIRKVVGGENLGVCEK